MSAIGIETVAGILVTVVAGEFTPLSCHVGVHGSVGDGVELEQPSGSLGCEYDMERLRIFFEHLSSPVDGDDNPGFNHAGIKYLIPFDPYRAYVGASYEFSDSHTTMENPLVIAGIETQGDVRYYLEHINSMTNPGQGETMMGVKFMF